MFYTKKSDYPNFATMKKLVILSVLLMLAAISFGQTVPIQAKKFLQSWGADNYSVTLNGDSVLIDASDFMWFAKKFGSDTLLFGDGTYMTTANTFVKLTGDTMNGTYLLNTGTFNMGAGTSLNMGGGTPGAFISLSNTTTYSTKGVKITDEEIIMRSDWTGTSPLGLLLKNDAIILTGGYGGGDVNTITSSSMSADYYAFNIDALTIDGRINGIEYDSDSTVSADDASIILTNSISGWGEVYAFAAGVIDEWAEFIISSDGAVYLKSNSTDVVNTDTDNKLCIFDNGTGVTIRNRLGGQRTVKYIIHH
jgi:hypothetical protein